MAQKLNPEELVSFEELLVSNTMQVDAVTQLLIKKGIITNEEFFSKGVKRVIEKRERA